MALLVAARDPTARQRGELGFHLRDMAEGVVPAPFQCSRYPPVVRIDPILVPSGPLDLVTRLLQGSFYGLPLRVMGRLDTIERRERRLDSRGLRASSPAADRQAGREEPRSTRPPRHTSRGTRPVVPR